MTIITYLSNNFKAFLRSWQFRWQQHKNYKKLQREEKALKKAKKIADKRAAMDGRRYYVLPDHNGDLMVLNSREIDRLKRFDIMSKKVTILDLLKESLYFTGKDPREK